MNAYRLRSIRPDLAPVAPAVFRRRRRIAAVVLLSAITVAAGLLDDPADHGPIIPVPNAPVFVDWRTGELVTP